MIKPINEYVDTLISARRYDIMNEGLFSSNSNNRYKSDKVYKREIDNEIDIVEKAVKKCISELNISNYVDYVPYGGVIMDKITSEKDEKEIQKQTKIIFYISGTTMIMNTGDINKEDILKWHQYINKKVKSIETLKYFNRIFLKSDSGNNHYFVAIFNQ